MKCINCGSKNLVNVGEDIFSCDECGSEIKISYFVCRKCFSSIRFKNGRIHDSISLAPESDQDNGIKSMADLIDRCLRCNQPVIVENGIYTCNNCGFVWETI